MTEEIFTEAAVSAWKADLVDIVREQSIARKLYPQDQAVSAADGNYIYYKIKEQSNVQYAYELQSRKYNKYATEKVSTAIPIHQGDLHFTRHEASRAAKDVLKLDTRVMNTIEDMVEQEERTAIYGDTDTGTVLSDTTNISTAATVELDFGTFAEGIEDFHLMMTQLRNLLKNKFVGCKLKFIQTTDMDDGIRARASTSNEAITCYDHIGKLLVDFNGGGSPSDHIFASNYLGSNTNAGTTNSALIASDPRNMRLITSPLEVTQGRDSLQNLDVQIAMRSKPIFFRGNDGVIYGGTSVITP